MTRKLPLLWKHFRDYHKNMSYYSEKRQTKYKVKSILANDEEFEIHLNTNCIILTISYLQKNRDETSNSVITLTRFNSYTIKTKQLQSNLGADYKSRVGSVCRGDVNPGIA